MHASRFGQCAVVTKLCVNALKRLQGAGALDYSAVEWPRALPFVRYCWRTSNRSHAAFFGSSVVSKSCCMHPEPTGEVITAKFREISRPACEGYGRFERRALRRSSPTASCNHLRACSRFIMCVTAYQLGLVRLKRSFSRTCQPFTPPFLADTGSPRPGAPGPCRVRRPGRRWCGPA